MTDATPGLNRIERILAFMIASSAGLAIVAIVAVVIAGLLGVELGSGIWLTVVVLPPVGLTLAVVLIVAFLIVRLVGRRRVDGADR